jgi:hypothetical protein
MTLQLVTRLTMELQLQSGQVNDGTAVAVGVG